jgi:Uma2 family endonuclease
MPMENAEPMTAEQFAEVDVPGKWTELVRGHLVVREPPFTDHGIVAANLGYFVSHFVREHDLGVVCGQDTGFRIATNPDTVRAPDLAFISRMRAVVIRRREYAALAPDLVAEVVSANDRRGELLEKVGQWLDAGVRLVWVIDPMRAEAHVHRPDGSLTVIGEHGDLVGEDVIPEFRCSLAAVLEVVP